jgi:hypothetical protein
MRNFNIFIRLFNILLRVQCVRHVSVQLWTIFKRYTCGPYFKTIPFMLIPFFGCYKIQLRKYRRFRDSLPPSSLDDLQKTQTFKFLVWNISTHRLSWWKEDNKLTKTTFLYNMACRLAAGQRPRNKLYNGRYLVTAHKQQHRHVVFCAVRFDVISIQFDNRWSSVVVSCCCENLLAEKLENSVKQRSRNFRLCKPLASKG